MPGHPGQVTANSRNESGTTKILKRLPVIKHFFAPYAGLIPSAQDEVGSLAERSLRDARQPDPIYHLPSDLDDKSNTSPKLPWEADEDKFNPTPRLSF